MHVGFTVDNDMTSRDATGNPPGIIYSRGTEAVEVRSQSAFDQSMLADYTAAAQVTPGREMHFTAGPYRPTKPAADFVIAKVDMSAAARANGRCRRTADLLFSFAFKTLDLQAALPLPKIVEFLENGRTCGRRG